MALGIAIIFGIMYLMLAYYLRKTATFEEFSVGNRNIGGFFIFSSLSATIIGPGFSLAFVNQGFTSGFFFAILALAYALQMMVVGIFIAPVIRRRYPNANSIGDIIAGNLAHNSRILKISVGMISVIVGVGVIGILTKAGGTIFQELLGVKDIYGAMIMTLIVIAYSYSGGIRASIITDSIQFILFIILIPSVIIIFLNQEGVALDVIYNKSLELTKFEFDAKSTIAIIGLVTWMVFGDILQPPILNRILSSKNSIVAKYSFVITGGFVFLWLSIMSLVGVIAHFSKNTPSATDSLLIEIGKEYYPPEIYGIFIVAMIGIVMSSQDSIINSTATVFVKDIIQPLKNNKKVTDNNDLMLSKLFTIFIGLSGLIVSFAVPTILDGLLFVASIWASTILIAMLASVFLNNFYWQAAFVSMITGFFSSLLWTILGYSTYTPSIIVGLLLSLLSYIVIYSILMRKKK